MTEAQQFDKYREKGAYHWLETRFSLRRFNAGLGARYAVASRIIFKHCASPDTIVDVGCGDGRFTAMLAGRYTGARIFGYDFDETAVRLANEKRAELGMANVTFGVGDAFVHSKVSLVTATDVIEHLDDTDDFMRRSFEMTAPGGFIFLSTPVKIKAIPDDKYHVREFATEELIRYCKGFSFEVVAHAHSHDALYLENYGRRMTMLGVGKARLYKYYYNFLALCLGMNVFERTGCARPAMQYILLKRP